MESFAAPEPKDPISSRKQAS